MDKLLFEVILQAMIFTLDRKQLRWKLHRSVYMPTTTDMCVAPTSFLEFVRWKKIIYVLALNTDSNVLLIVKYAKEKPGEIQSKRNPSQNQASLINLTLSYVIFEPILIIHYQLSYRYLLRVGPGN